MRRRSFLRLAGLSALGAVAAPNFARASGPLDGLLGLNAPVDTAPQIKHVLTLMMENHSFDNVLGMLRRPGVDGFTFSGDTPINSNPDADGNPVAAFQLPTMCQDDFHVNQSWPASHRQWNNGAMDGFVVTSGREAMGYYTEEQLPITYALAKQFPVCDRWFCSTMTQTYPNRMFMYAGTSQGSIKTDIPERVNGVKPAAGTIFDRLDSVGLSWKNYAFYVGDSMLWGPDYFLSKALHFAPIAEFYADAALGTLPAFSVITIEPEEMSEENPQNVSLGEAFVWSVIDAVFRSPAWESTMLLLTYDEGGGYYDHVPPVPVPNPDGIHPATDEWYGDDFTYTGFRVPTVLVSPWAKSDHVSHTFYDHTSLLAFLERKHGFAPLTNRDAAANDMFDLFDFSTPAFATPPQIPLPNALEETVKCLQSGQTGLNIPGV